MYIQTEIQGTPRGVRVHEDGSINGCFTPEQASKFMADRGHELRLCLREGYSRGLGCTWVRWKAISYTTKQNIATGEWREWPRLVTKQQLSDSYLNRFVLLPKKRGGGYRKAKLVTWWWGEQMRLKDQ
jgi:hypothetical protein